MKFGALQQHGLSSWCVAGMQLPGFQAATPISAAAGADADRGCAFWPEQMYSHCIQWRLYDMVRQERRRRAWTAGGPREPLYILAKTSRGREGGRVCWSKIKRRAVLSRELPRGACPERMKGARFPRCHGHMWPAGCVHACTIRSRDSLACLLV